MPQRRHTTDEVSLQVTTPPRVKQQLDVHAAQTGRTKRTVVLEALRSYGFELTDREVIGG